MFNRNHLAVAGAVLLAGVAAASETIFADSPQLYSRPDAISSQVVEGTYAGGDQIETNGQRVPVRIVSNDVAAFLDAHRGRAMVMRLDTVRLGDGRAVEVVSDARVGDLTAAVWWRSQGPTQRASTVAGSDAGMLIGGMMRALAPMAAAAVSPTRYVSPAGIDTNDCQSPATACQTITRALADVPAVVDDHWTIRLAAGEYAESVELRRFAMPAAISNQQLRDEPIIRAIALVGDAGAVISPPAGQVCLTASGVALFLDTLTCRVSGANGISSAGSTLVLDDVRLEAPASAAHALYAETSLVYFGGSFEVDGPFSIGLAVRTNTLARTGSRRNQSIADLTFRGLGSHAIFVRDGGNFTTAFETGTIRIEDSGQAIYALLGSRVFLSSGFTLEMEDVGTGIVATQQSAINIHRAVLTGPMPNPFVRCFLGSYLALEIVTADPTRPADTDGTCTAFVF